MDNSEAVSKIDTAIERLNEARTAIVEQPKPAPGPVELGEWRGYTLLFYADAVKVCPSTATQWTHWIPGNSMAGRSPELVNALLTAYRRAVERKLTTWPEGWAWAEREAPDWWVSVYGSHVYLGEDDTEILCCWPIGAAKGTPMWNSESARRAALLGLCEAKPASEAKSVSWSYHQSAMRDEANRYAIQSIALKAARTELLAACYEVLVGNCGAAKAFLPLTITPGCVSDSIHATVSGLNETLDKRNAEIKRLTERNESLELALKSFEPVGEYVRENHIGLIGAWVGTALINDHKKLRGIIEQFITRCNTQHEEIVRLSRECNAAAKVLMQETGENDRLRQELMQTRAAADKVFRAAAYTTQHDKGLVPLEAAVQEYANATNQKLS